MALSSAFQDRIRQMEETKNQRLALLQAEKELRNGRSQLLSAKLSNLRRAEQRCLLLEKRQADVACRILAKKAEIEAMEAKYQSSTSILSRDLRSEAEELKEKETIEDDFYKMKVLETEEFKERVRARTRCLRAEVQKLRATLSELRGALEGLQEGDGCSNNSELAAAEQKKAELQSAEENLRRTLGSNLELRTLLRRQLQRALSAGAAGGGEEGTVTAATPREDEAGAGGVAPPREVEMGL